MRAVISSFGSTGDIQPFLALAVELRRRGHQPIMASFPYFAAHVRQAGIEFCAVGPQIDDGEIQQIGALLRTISNPIEQMRRIWLRIMPTIPQVFQDLVGLCRDADVLIGPPFQIACRMVHEVLAVPFVSVLLSQFSTLRSKAFRETSAAIINPARAAVGLPSLRDPLGDDGISTQLALYALSRHLFRLPPHTPPHHHVSGFFFLDQEWQPDPALEAFLAAGDPPVVISFGSMMHDDPDACTDMLLAAIERAGCRAIIQRGWSGLGQRRLPGDVYTLDFVPHSWLFPRARCVVHHGGAGTTAAALRAGVPAVIVPHALDQPIWAEVTRAMGCTGAVISRPQLNAERLSAAIVKTVSTPRYREAAARMGERIRAEQGVQTACQLIDQLVGA